MFGNTKSTARREEIRKNRPDAGITFMTRMRAEGMLVSLAVAVVFCIAATAILVMREDVVHYRPGEWTTHDIVARVDFPYRDERLLNAAHEVARNSQPRIYRQVQPDIWKSIEDELLALPDRVKGMTLVELPQELGAILDAGSLAKLQEFQAAPQRQEYEQSVHSYVDSIRQLNLIILPEDQRKEDLTRIISVIANNVNTPIRTEASTFNLKMADEIATRFLLPAQRNFTLALQSKVVALTKSRLGITYTLDEAATTKAKNDAEASVSPNAGDLVKAANTPIVKVDPGGGKISEEDWILLKAENDEYLRKLGPARLAQRAGLAGVAILLTFIMCVYTATFQPKIVRNHARAIAIAVLLLSMMLLATVAALSSNSLYLFAVAPTILVAMILSIAYNQRFALGLATFHAILVTFAIDADLSFLLILESGVVVACFLLDDLRTRSKLIEVGGLTAMALIVATSAAGLLSFDPLQYIARQCLYAGAAGLAVGFVVLGILPFIEKAFRITTNMTLLELADASQPLLRRLAIEAPGTYNHSLQVATLAEEAAEAIGANSLLCRVASYYHDVGKINKADYFVENQSNGENRHINLSPSVSLLIIIGHVKDGLELAREYNLPTSIFPFIQQHHGTTLVEYFYQRACDTCTPDQPDVSETQYRYPGPKPKSREIAILMLADAMESAARTMSEPTANRIESLVHEITLRRLQDGQLTECDLTMRDLERIERSFAKTLMGIYHGRIAYPSTSALASSSAQTEPPAAKTA
ncbi:MAG TPA: HDIG domain-containing protein [Tepidisphaeraceae bacterium]|nr:HDIG domain-containing protein [Tepidisphaeraceae bacterium]